MNKQTQQYYDQSHTWTDDIYSHAVIWRNWALLIALLSLMTATIAVFSAYKLFPLKENTPFLVFVDNQKGEPVMIRPITSDDFTENDHLKIYMIRKFITARERYHENTLTEDAETVAALSVESVYAEYRHAIAKNNPKNPEAIYKNASLDITDINISFLNPQRAYVSFIILVNQDGVIKEVPAHAQIKFQFTDQEISIDTAQLINPVNFEVLSYQSHYQINNEVVYD